MLMHGIVLYIFTNAITSTSTESINWELIATRKQRERVTACKKFLSGWVLKTFIVNSVADYIV